ncbi:MAG: hypothetical protein QNJ54_38130, partial [Prochloraceae cyanobacterium]|nr:hypothetical protein [Prochloraceae cyanobacterium]
EDLSIAAIEKKPDGAFVVRLNVSPYADKGEIESLTKQLYEEKLKLIEAQHRAELKSLETKYSIELSNKEEIIELHKKHYSDILELGKLAASRPIENDINFNPNLDLQVMSDSTGRQIKAKGDVVGNILGDSSTISGTVAKSIGQLPSSSDPNQPGIKELLEQLKNAHRYADLFEIATDSRLEEKQKEKLLKRVKNLADAALNPNDESLKDMAENAIEFLKNNLPPTAAAFTVGNRVLPAIAKILGF